eukprot:TRINITY_DN14556_c0_g1_i1.p1 TRINITY_DN14556_c0_g1~~TRINITY_DN14556_c0_g1_i1.p1  ORF type:complete len:392 (-),score=77.72 TRINITY_DN14556_c0_g1_i1:377-1552(-)
MVRLGQKALATCGRSIRSGRVDSAGVALARMFSSAAADANQSVIVEEVGAVRLITLNRPKALNALDYAMVKQMRPRYSNWIKEHTDGQPRIVVMKGAGGKAFCAGGDVLAIATDKEGTLRRDFFRDEYRLNYTIKTLSFPHVALLDGIVMGGGVGLSMHGSHRIVTEATLFAMPETGIGLFPDVGGSVFLPQLPYAGLGMFLALTGYRLKGADCLHAGVGTHFVAKDTMASFEEELLKQDALEGIDGVLAKYSAAPSSLPAFGLEADLDRIADVFTLGSVDTILERLARDGDEWSTKTLSTLKKMSPTSLKVTFEQLKRGATQSTHDNFAMEARIVWGMMNIGTDFNEGIRALLIDKDKSPKWSPASVEMVTQDVVDQYFASLGAEEWSAE